MNKLSTTIVLLIVAIADASTVEPISLDIITEQTDCWIRGEVISVETRLLSHDERYKFDYEGTVEVKAVVRIHEALPQTEASEVTVHWVTYEDFLKRIVEGRECITALSLREDGTYKSLSALGRYGWFQPEPTTGHIESVLPIGLNVKPDLVWELVRDLRLVLSAIDQPNNEVVNSWLNRIHQGDIHEFFAAIAFLSALPGVRISTDELMVALERIHERYRAQMDDSKELRISPCEFRRSLPFAINLLKRVGNEVTTERLVDLYLRDLQTDFCSIENREVIRTLVEMIALHGGADRCAMLTKLMNDEKVIRWQTEDSKLTAVRSALSAAAGVWIAEFDGEEIDALLIDMLQRPSSYGVSYGSDLVKLWQPVAQRGLPEFKAYLDEFRANPESFALGVEHPGPLEELVRGATWALVAFAETLPHTECVEGLLETYRVGREPSILHGLVGQLTREDTGLIPQLAAIPANELRSDRGNLDRRFADMIATKLPDPAFLPQLRELVKINPDASILRALRACGDPNLARSVAQERLKRPLPIDGGLVYIHRDIFAKTHILEFLGTLEGPELVPDISPYADPQLLEEYRSAARSASRMTGVGSMDYTVSNLGKAAILALARSGGTSVVPQLQEAYRRGDVFARVAAAMSLYALEDGSGTELIKLFVEHRESERTDIAREWRPGLRTKFCESASYLKNPRTDAVLLERIKQGFSDSDTDIASYREFADANIDILLPIVVKNLSNKDPMLREYAHRLLVEFIGPVTDFDPNKSPERQLAVIERIRDKANAYLASRGERSGA